MRLRYENAGLDDFELHEILEMLLFSSIPQGNTNPAAHLLLDACGSMEAVLEGETAVCGVGEKSLAMLRRTGEAMDACFLQTLREAEKIGRSQLYMAAVYCLRRSPTDVFVLITDREGRLQEMDRISVGVPEEILQILQTEMEPEQCCHLACIAEEDCLRPLRKQYGKTILGELLCLTKDWRAKWL